MARVAALVSLARTCSTRAITPGRESEEMSDCASPMRTSAFTTSSPLPEARAAVRSREAFCSTLRG